MTRKNVQFNVNPLFNGPSLTDRQSLGSPYRELLISEIDVDPDQPRRVFDTEALAELAASIGEYGVISPILVRISEGGTYRLIAGERRLRASKLAGKTMIPAVVESADSDDVTILPKQLVENLQRQDLTSMERALAIGQMRDQTGWSIREIAKRLGVSKSLVQRSLEILAIPDDLQAALIAGSPESKVLLLGKVKDRAQRKALLARIADLSREDVEREVEFLVHGAAARVKVSHRGTRKKDLVRRTVSVDDQRLVAEMQESLGMKVDLVRRKGKEPQGKLTVEFYSDDDLAELYDRLS